MWKQFQPSLLVKGKSAPCPTKALTTSKLGFVHDNISGVLNKESKMVGLFGMSHKRLVNLKHITINFDR